MSINNGEKQVIKEDEKHDELYEINKELEEINKKIEKINIGEIKKEIKALWPIIIKKKKQEYYRKNRERILSNMIYDKE